MSSTATSCLSHSVPPSVQIAFFISYFWVLCLYLYSILLRRRRYACRRRSSKQQQ
jgi:hypothetical protein